MKLLCCFTVQTHAKLNNFNPESDPWLISHNLKNFLNKLLHNALDMDLLSTL